MVDASVLDRNEMRETVFSITTSTNTRLCQMSLECDICLKTYSSSRNLHRHKQNVHNVRPKVQPFACSDCDFQNTSLVTMKQHFLEKHGHIIKNPCFYCNIVYGETVKNSHHLEHDHGLSTIFTPGENSDIEKMTC